MAKKKRRAIGFGPMVLLVIILIVLGFIIMSLLGGSMGINNLLSGNQQGSESVIDETGAENVVITIEVSDHQIIWDGEEIEESELHNKILSQDPSTQYTVIDNSAIKSSYDKVIDELTQQQAVFQESELQ